jgi:hypothetical protein
LQYGIVVFLDILGTKELGNRDDDAVEEFTDLFDSFASKAAEMVSNIKSSDLSSGEKLPTFECLNVSDTLVITGAIEGISSWPLDLHSLSVSGFLCSLILGEVFIRKIYLRGGIGIGKYYKKNNAIAGKAVSEVYEYHQQLEMIGVGLAPSANYTFTIRKDFDQPSLIKQDIQLKAGIERDAWVVNLPQAVAWAEHSKDKLLDYRQIMIEKCKNAQLSSVLKWRNTETLGCGSSVSTVNTRAYQPKFNNRK